MNVRWMSVWFFVLLSSPVLGQVPHTDSFCNAGLHPDGYVDLSGMPAAPDFPTQDGAAVASAAFTVSLPVKGIPGLNVQITIPPLESPNAGPIYTVANGALLLNGFAHQSGEILALRFNQPVAGLGLVAGSEGREADFSLQTDAPSDVPPLFVNAANALTMVPKYYSVPLQEVDLEAGFSTAFVLSHGSPDFGTPSLSNLRVQSTGASQRTNVPKSGLQQWLMSESVQSPFLGDASSWPDQSGEHHPATQTVAEHQPIPVPSDGNACQAAFLFMGNQYFDFDLNIDGWQAMTVFLVAKASAAARDDIPPAAEAALFWNENALWGNTFVTPGQTGAIFRFGTTQAGNQPWYERPSNVGEDFTITRAVHDGSTDSLYVNGMLATREGNKLPVLGGMTGTGYIGRGLNQTYFKGEISEVLIYDRALSAEETAVVESYLRNKFGTR